MLKNWPVRAKFLSELDEISPDIPQEGIGFDNPGVLLLIDPYYKYLYSLETASFFEFPNGAVGLKGNCLVSEDYKEYWLTPKELVKNLVAYVDEDQVICCFNPRVVNDVLLKSTKVFSEAVGKPTTVKENVVAEPENKQRPYWMP